MKNLKSVKILLSLLFMASSTFLYSQDLVVTSEGDSLNCKITKIKGNSIYFTFKHKDEIRSTLLPLDQVKYHQYNFYQIAIVPANKIISNEIYPHFRVAINGGLSYRTAKLADNIPSDFEKYVKELKSGYHIGLDLSYYFSEQLGIGIKYSVYKSKNEIDNVSVTRPDGSTQYGKMSDNISINFIGPFISTRLLNGNKKNSFLMNLGIGYLGYTDNTLLITDYTIKGSTVGLCWDIGYDIGISKNLAIGFQLSYMIGTLTQYDISDGTTTKTVKLEKNNYESLSRIDLSIGLRFNK
jgi:hypothetical protein